VEQDLLSQRNRLLLAACLAAGLTSLAQGDSNQVASVETPVLNPTNQVKKSSLTTNIVISVTDTNFVTTAQDTNAVKSIQGDGDTNVVVSLQADEESSWDSTFAEENRVPFYINFYTKKGLFYEIMATPRQERKAVTAIFSEKRRITGKIGLKIHEDWFQYKEDDDLPKADDGFTLRRARLSTYGRTYLLRPVTYGVDIGIEDGDFFFYAGYLWLHEIPYAKSFKVGVFNAPVSLEALQSSSTIPLMESAAPVDAFSPGERAGIQIGGALPENKGTLYSGFFGGTYNKQDGETSDKMSRFMSRITWLPLDTSEAALPQLVHVGASVSYLYSDEDKIRFRARPESYSAPYVVNTGDLGGDESLGFGLETVWQAGPASLQGEFFQTKANDVNDDDHTFFGGYLTGSYFLTGETRPYNRETGTFSRLVPRRRFSFKEHNWGAWEWAMRMSYIDLSDGSVQGGKMSVLSTGLNCYLNRNSRIMLNVGMARIRDTAASGDAPPPDGKLYFLQTRFQFEF
jgi:phosphate-selective porin OprO/OprP